MNTIEKFTVNINFLYAYKDPNYLHQSIQYLHDHDDYLGVAQFMPNMDFLLSYKSASVPWQKFDSLPAPLTYLFTPSEKWC